MLLMVAQAFLAAVEVGDWVSTGQTSHLLPAEDPDANPGLSSAAGAASPWECRSPKTVPVHKMTDLLFPLYLSS